MTEAEYGAAWAKMARAEGQRPGLPPTPSKGTTGLSMPVVTACIAAGMTLKQIADDLGYAEGAVEGFCNRNGIETEMREAS